MTELRQPPPDDSPSDNGATMATTEPTRDSQSDMAALARGGRTNFFGFVLRLLARLPFLFIAGHLYGAEALGRFAYATMVVELMAQFATLGLKRGLAAELAKHEHPEAHVVGDGLVLAWALALAGAAVMVAIPEIVFPNSKISGFDRAFPLIGLAIVGSDVSLAALAFKHKIGAQVTARSIVEPWTLTIVAATLAFTPIKGDGLIIAYAASLAAALFASLRPCVQAFGWPRGWRPHPERLFRMARANAPLAGADAIDWASRRIDILILGLFATPAVLGVYYVAQQVTSLAQKLKVTFDPILAPVIARLLKEGDRTGIAIQLRQVSFWIIAAQLGVALTLGISGEVVMRLVGSEFTGGAMVLGILLAAEVLAATAAVAESALIYISRHRNLMWSLITIGLQIGLTLLLAPTFGGAGAAAALALAATFGSVVKVRLLRDRLGARVTGWRWAMLLAAGAALIVGLFCQLLPPFWRLVIGVPAILAAYAIVLWYRGFRDSDRILFTKKR